MPDLPSGTVTFLFTDIEGSTALWERDTAAMHIVVDRHLGVLDEAIAAHGGIHFKTVGDAVQAAFPTAPDAIAAALDAQRALMQEAWPDAIGSPKVRMAMHTTAATPQGGDYLAPGLNRLSRLLGAGHGGQILLSLATQDLARDGLPAGADLRDLGDHPLRDLHRSERVFQLLHPDLPTDFPLIRTLATRPNNLPLQQTPFLGRENQVGQVVDLLRRDDIRLLTITGPGGVGKTRLALQVAAELLDAFPDGAWFVDLSTLSDPSLVASTILVALGSREAGGSAEERLATVIAGKQELLVLDNFERVVEAAPLIGMLLARVSELRVLTTSRTPLHAYGEREYPLDALPLPDYTQLPSLEQLSQNEAVRLFIERAQAVKPDFPVTPANGLTVAEICSRLDGIPLAIELAAAQIKVLPPQALLKRLEKRLPLLIGGARTLPARQQTMRNAIDWGHDLLTPDEQILFRRLAVFPGGCTLEAAEAVASEEDALDVYVGIASVVDKSLLRQVEGSEGEPRFRMAETVREYGLERLDASDEAENIRKLHAAYFRTVAERGAVGLRGPGESQWGIMLEAELDNFRAALEWLVSHDSEAAWGLAGALGIFWHRFGHFIEGRRWLDRVQALPHPDAPSVAQVDVLDWAGLLAHLQGDHVQATTWLTEALRGARELDNARRITVTLQGLGIVAEDSGEYDEAREFLEEALGIHRNLNDHYEEALTLAHLGIVSYGQGDYEQAAAHCISAHALAQEASNVTARFLAPLTLGHIATEDGDFQQAADWYREVLAVLEQFGGLASLKHGGAEGVARTLAGVAFLATAQGQAVRAARLFGMAEAARALIGLVPTLPESAVYERATVTARNQIGETLFADAYDEGRRSSVQKVLEEVEAVLENASDSPG